MIQAEKKRDMVARRMRCVREAFRCHRVAQAHRDLWRFYREHTLFEQAHESRLVTMRYLRSARRHWRVTLGLPE